MDNETNEKYSYGDLDKESIELAKKELKEDPKQLHAHLESFRRWIKSMPHLTCPLDDEFLIRFLRVAKFDHGKAQERLDNFCTIRSSERGVPQWFPKTQIDDATIDQFLATKMQIPLGLNAKKEYVILVRPGNWDPEKLPIEKLSICAYMGIDMMIRDQHCQINGVVSILDFSSAGQKHMKAWATKTHIKNWTRCFQDSYPMRQKSTFFYKEPVIFDVVFKMMEFFMSDKMKKRQHRVKDDYKKIHAQCPGAIEILPTELGGKGGTIDEIVAKHAKEFKEYYSKPTPLSIINVDESKRPATTLKYLRQYGDYGGPTLDETVGTFTKLEI